MGNKREMFCCRCEWSTNVTTCFRITFENLFDIHDTKETASRKLSCYALLPIKTVG